MFQTPPFYLHFLVNTVICELRLSAFCVQCWRTERNIILVFKKPLSSGSFFSTLTVFTVFNVNAFFCDFR